jgi:hypothetical protein
MKGLKKKNPWMPSIFLVFFFLIISSLIYIRMQPVEAAANDVILMWDGATSTIPSGWTCISCRTTDGTGATSTFLNAFPKASSTFGSATTSADFVTHTVTFSASTSGTGIGHNSAAAGTAFPRDTHTHTWGNPTMRAENILPLYKGLLLIKATNPTQIPANAIAMFDVPSSSLPTGWTYYSTIENRYLRTSFSTSTGGAAFGAATTTAAITSGASVGAYTDPGNGQTVASSTHTHTIAVSSTLPLTPNSPSYIGVVFGKATATTSIPIGMLAFFDATPPAGWSTLSTNGSAWDNRLIVGSTTFGNTGGAATHDHGGTVTWTSSAPSLTGATGSGSAANTALSTHTHGVTYTINSTSSMPTNRGVIIGKKLAPHETQANYRWYTNQASSTPGAALVAMNTSTTVSTGNAYRLRMNIRVATSSVSQLNNFELQFATSTSGPWTDVGAIGSGEIWRGYDNAATVDSTLLPTLLLTSSTIKQTYEEQNPATSTINAMAIGDYGEWDWVLENNNAPGGNYFFRMAWSDGTALDSYLNYPAVSAAQTISCSAAVISTDFGALSLGGIATSVPDVSSTITCGGSLGCTLTIENSVAGLVNTSSGAIPNLTGTLVAGTEGYGIQATTTAVGSGATLGINSIYGGSKFGTDNVGALNFSTQVLASSTAAVTNREVVVRHKAAISPTTVVDDYTDTITYSCVGN